VLLAALGQRGDGRQLIGLDRFLEIGMGNTRDPSEKTKIAGAASRWSSAIAAAVRPRVIRPAARQLDGFL
jgi:hypothetical protein